MRNLLFFLVVNLSTSLTIYASHIRAGEITSERLNCNGRDFVFTLTAYRDTGSNILFGQGVFNFGDGKSISLDPNGYFLKESLDNEVEKVQFRIPHTYDGNGTFRVSYVESFRNDQTININGGNSGQVDFYIESLIRLDPYFGCNQSPVFDIPPIDEGAVGVLFFHNPGARDQGLDGDSLAYKKINPKFMLDTDVPNYVQPNDIGGGLNEQQTDNATYTINPISGDVIWDAPAIVGQYNIAFIVEEWRKINGKWELLGFITRDMQITIGETDNLPPMLEIPRDTCVEAGTLLEAEIVASDPDLESLVQIEAFGFPLSLNPAATLTPTPAVFEPSPTSATFSWQTSCDHIREDPYQVRFKATDNGPGIRLTKFETWNVTVVPPAPKNVVAESRPQRSIEITWDEYNCGLAEVIQVYRRVDSYDFTPENCEIGIPENGGYELIGAAPVSQNSFLDNNAGRGLAFGATYCYRLVAVFELPTGGVSYASEEVCQQIAATGPIITNTSITNTDSSNGEVIVSWLPPFEIDTAIYPPPYKYQLLRGVNGSFEPIAVVEDDTTYTDSGINTEEEFTSYRLELYLLNQAVEEENLIEISATASTVRLNSVSLFEAIQLNWTATVPWSNTNQEFPYHYIYRNKVNENDTNEFVLIDSVDVTQYGFQYTDSGSFNNVNLSNDEQYCYYVTTSGGYGNDNIFEPLLNNSQELCAMPDDQIDPCPPFEVDFDLGSLDECLEFLADKDCGFDDFENTLFWDATVVDSCDIDVSYYEVFYTNTLDGDFNLVGTTTETTFTHKELQEYAGCYKIRAVDQSENRSAFSETFCKENCPNIAFPNVITPNNDGVNDVFTPYYPGATDLATIPFDKCPRFLKEIHFRVYNRYGKEVYNYKSGGENSVYIKWDGTAFSGQELPSATYYYEATVTFKMLRPENKTKVFKGWVEIIK